MAKRRTRGATLRRQAPRGTSRNVMDYLRQLGVLPQSQNMTSANNLLNAGFGGNIANALAPAPPSPPGAGAGQLVFDPATGTAVNPVTGRTHRREGNFRLTGEDGRTTDATYLPPPPQNMVSVPDLFRAGFGNRFDGLLGADQTAAKDQPGFLTPDFNFGGVVSGAEDRANQSEDELNNRGGRGGRGGGRGAWNDALSWLFRGRSADTPSGRGGGWLGQSLGWQNQRSPNQQSFGQPTQNNQGMIRGSRFGPGRLL